MSIVVNSFASGYVKAALWASMDESDPNTGGHQMNERFTVVDIHPDTLRVMVDDCARFEAENADNIHGMEFDAGIDFWLSRNGHGAGFFSNDEWGEAQERLQERAQAYGEFDLYVGDDGRVHGCGG